MFPVGAEEKELVYIWTMFTRNLKLVLKNRSINEAELRINPGWCSSCALSRISDGFLLACKEITRLINWHTGWKASTRRKNATRWLPRRKLPSFNPFSLTSIDLTSGCGEVLTTTLISMVTIEMVYTSCRVLLTLWSVSVATGLLPSPVWSQLQHQDSSW